MRGTRAAVAALFALALLGFAVPPASAAQPQRSGDLAWSVTLAGRDISTATAGDPLRLTSNPETPFVVGLQNTGTTPVRIEAVVVEGRVIGLPFYSYRSRVAEVLAGGARAELHLTLDLSTLDDQARGLIPSAVRLVGPDKQDIARQSFTADIQGRLLSAYGLFSGVIAVVTLFLCLGLLNALARGFLPLNRWRRAMQFLPVGVGLGLTATFTLSAFRVLAPGAAIWLPLVLVFGGAAFVLGYLTPTPDDQPAPAARTAPAPSVPSRGEPLVFGLGESVDVRDDEVDVTGRQGPAD